MKRFSKIAEEEQVRVHAYSLLDNHVHFLLTPKTPNGLARLFHRLHTWWAGRYNTRTGRTGPLFEGRFHSSAVDEPHFWAALRYIELNAKRAGITRDLAQWPFSSAKAHLTGNPDRFVRLEDEAIRRRRWTITDWRYFLASSDKEAEERLQKCIRTSRPCGEGGWVTFVVGRYGRRHTSAALRAV